MKATFILLLFLFSFGTIGAVSADYSSGLSAYNKGNYKVALSEWLPLAKEGVSQAQYNLGGMYAKGYGVVINDKDAVFWYKKAAEQAHPMAQYNLGLMYLIGAGIGQSFVEAKHWLYLSYENGVDDAEILWNQYELWKY